MREKGATEDEMVGWHCRFDGHEFEQAPGDGGGQGSLVGCRLWGRTESDTTEATQQQGVQHDDLTHMCTEMVTTVVKLINIPISLCSYLFLFTRAI